MIDIIDSFPELLLISAALFCAVSIAALIAAGFHATAYRRKLNEFELHMRKASGERANAEQSL